LCDVAQDVSVTDDDAAPDDGNLTSRPIIDSANIIEL